MYKFEKIYIEKTTHDWQNSFKSWRCKIIYFFTSIGNLYWEQCFLGVCAVVCLRAFFWELTVTGSLCWDFFCVAISLRAFSCQLASVVDFCGVVYLCISLFRNILFFFWRKYIYCFLGSFSWEIWVDRIYGWCGLVFPIYIFCSCSFFNFQICSILFFCNAY